MADLKAQGARMLTYVNPFLSVEPGHDSLFTEGKSKGYLVQNADGTPFLNKNTSFSAALVDLSNPDARIWIKGVIKTNMIEASGTSGWMHDFGEALPFYGKIAGGDPAAFHNQYPVEWARVAGEAIEEAGRGDDIVFFDRSGYSRSPGEATLFWLGDQLQSWDEYDGIKTALVGLLSSGVSGYSKATAGSTSGPVSRLVNPAPGCACPPLWPNRRSCFAQDLLPSPKSRRRSTQSACYSDPARGCSAIHLGH